ncbi:MAG: CHAT domain-containing protein [Nitrospirae bacterium]|nr:CHAT domain-containing protein [Nitrospirota bacterium]
MEKKKIFLVVLFVFVISGSAFAQGKDEAERLWELGEKAFESGKYKEAASYYEKSLSKCAGSPECISSNKNGLGRVHEELGDYKKALSHYEDALRAARQINHRDFIATNLFNIGSIYNQNLSQNEKAFSLLEESLRIFRELNDKESTAIVLFNIGKAANSLGRYDKALSYFIESLRMNREKNNQNAIAGNLNLIGNVYSNMGHYDKTLSYYQEALAINRRLNTPKEIAISLRNIGDAYCELIEHDKALSYYTEALDIQKKQNAREDIAITLTNLGAYYKDINQYDKALSHQKEALKISDELDNQAMKATNLSNIGNTYTSLGRSDSALLYYRQALNIEGKINRPKQRAIVLNNIGMEYFRVGQYEQALLNLNEALDIERKLDNTHNIAARLNNIGAVYLSQKKYKEAEKIFLERKEAGKKITKTRLIHAGLIQVYLAEKKYNEALALLEELPPTWRDSRNRRMEYHTQYGQALKGKGLLGKSSQELFKAVAIVEELRTAVSERSGFFSGGGYISRLTPHRELAAVLAEMERKGEKADDAFGAYGKDSASSGFYFSEMTKARTLLEAMSDSARKYNAPEIPAEIKSRESAILKELAAIKDNWDNAFAKGQSVFKKLSQKKDRLDSELDSLISSLKKDFPQYAAIHYPSPIHAEEIPLKADEVLIEFGISGDSAVAFVLRKGGLSGTHKIDISAEELSDRIKKFIEPFSTGKDKDVSLKFAKELYGLLLADALKDVKYSERLIIVPDGILGLLPFEALVIKEGKDYKDTIYLGDKWTVTYAQSATSLALTRLLKPTIAEKPLFALGNPIYDKSDPRYAAYKRGETQPAAKKELKQYAYRGLTILPKSNISGDAIVWEDVEYPALPETEDEIKAIAKILGVKPEQPDVLLNILATETNFRNAKLRDYRYLHFATHADLPGKVQGLKEPFIILGQVENKNDDDGFLTLSEVLELKLNADMVVLSACSTGRGKMMEGEGVANFARAFQHAGSKSVVVSLWEVASEPAVEYMKIFYAHLKEGKSRAASLRLAKNAMKLKYPNPFYWAVFILHGEG